MTSPFLLLTAAMLSGITTLGCQTATAEPAATVASTNDLPASVKQHGFAIGCQAWTFNHFTAFEAIEKTAAAGGSIIELFPGQKLSPKDSAGVGSDLSEAQITLLKAQLEKFHVKAVNFGVVNIPKDEAAARKLFQFAKTMGLYAITTESTDAIDTIEKLVKEFDMHVAFHNHARRANYKMWDPNYILSVVKDRDPRIGACADVGHWSGSGMRPLDQIKILEGRVMSCHFKDHMIMNDDANCVAAGLGALELEAVLRELRRQHFNGNISVEFESHWENNLAEVAQTIGFVRGVGAALEMVEADKK